MYKFIIIIFCYSASVYLQAQTLEQNFISPPLEARPRALWTWVNGNFDKKTITYELEQAKEKNMGGFDIWDVNMVQDEKNRVPKGKPFMGDEYTDAIVHTINEATRLGLDIGIIISSGWNAGGKWTKAQNATMGIFRTSKIVKGGKNIVETLNRPALPKSTRQYEKPRLIATDQSGKPLYYKDIAVIAYPLTKDSTIADSKLVIDLTNKMDSTGKLSWAAPPGDWLIERMACFNTGQPMISSAPSSEGLMIDHFNPTATETHLNYFIDKIKPALGGSFEGKALKYLYTDSYEVVGELWSPDFTDRFRQQFGYDMLPFMPALKGFTVVDKETTRRFIYDFRQFLSDAIIAGHYQKGVEVCAKHGIGFVAEAAGPGAPIHNCPFESLKSSGVLSFPRGEFWHKTESQPILQVIKGVASASHIYNQKYVEAESFTSVWLWQESLYELRPTADRAFCEGLNRIIFHTFPHTPITQGKPGYIYGFGTQISVNQPWWHKSKPFMNYLARCSYMLQQGNFCANIAYYYGDEAPNFVNPKAEHNAYIQGHDFDAVNTDILLNKLSVKNGLITLPHGQSYKLLLLPDKNEMKVEVLIKIMQMVYDGAIVVGPKPLRSTGYKNYEENDKKIIQMANTLWGNMDGKTVTMNTYGNGKIYYGKPINDILSENNILPTLKVSDNVYKDSIDYIKRATDAEDIYFIRTMCSKPTTIPLMLLSSGTPLIYDAVSGQITNLKYTKSDNYLSVNVEFEPKGSFFIVVKKQSVDVATQDFIVNPITKSKKATRIQSPWKLTLGNNNYPLTTLIDLSTSQVEEQKCFSGTMVYETEINIPSDAELTQNNIYIDLGNVGIVSEAYVNNISAGICWNTPFVHNLTGLLKKGKNTLKVEVCNRWVNRLVCDSKLPNDKRTTNTNITRQPNGWMSDMTTIPNEKYKIPLSGMAGPVQLHYIPK
ncbi:MAG: glycosyl hydrolase [Cytophagales bacterium]|nr:glycosyl hydrolase [Cytophagales bacterium]